MTARTTLVLNDREITTSKSAGTLVLDFLRRDRKLVGTKEGCKEGDCGACVVLVGQLRDRRVEYEPVTSCLMPVAELHGKHLVTVEGLNSETLTPVQEAIVEEGGSQCGFCTPGIVMSLTGFLLQSDWRLDDDGLKYALGGNLCRCTGYASLKRAGAKIRKDVYMGEKSNGASSDPLQMLIAKKVVPDYFRSIPERLAAIATPIPESGTRNSEYTIAGGTDIYVQRGAHLPDAKVQVLNLRPELKGIAVKDGKVHMGALTTFEEFAYQQDIRTAIPNIRKYMLLNASWQIRNRATIGGNIVNASPIGDLTALLLALESDLLLQDGDRQRVVPMKKFFQGYKKLAKTDSEILAKVVFPLPVAGTQINFEKVSKRRTLDIASVNSAVKVRIPDGLIEDVQLSMGGVAPTPFFMHKTCAFLRGQPVSPKTILAAAAIADSEIAPIDDIRGSAAYKRLLVRQFLIAHFSKLFPDQISVRTCYETY